MTEPNDPASSKITGVELISESERFSVEACGCTFFYRRMPKAVRRRLKKEHTTRGILDDDAFTDACLKYCVIGWDGVRLNGEPAGFNPELVLELPDAVLGKITNCVFGTVAGEPVEGANPFLI